MKNCVRNYKGICTIDRDNCDTCNVYEPYDTLLDRFLYWLGSKFVGFGGLGLRNCSGELLLTQQQRRLIEDFGLLLNKKLNMKCQ